MTECKPYTIRIEEEGQLLVVRVTGFWTAQHFENYRRDVSAKVRALARAQFDFLFDMSKAPPQSGPVSAGMAELSEEFRKWYDLRVALVVSSALVKMQVTRIRHMADPGRETETEYFINEDEARAWLVLVRSGLDHGYAQQSG